MLTEADLVKAERGELVKLVQRRFQDGTHTLRGVHAKALHVLGTLADHPRCRRVIWPVLLSAVVVREYAGSADELCRVLKRLFRGIELNEQREELAAAFVNDSRPHRIVAWCFR